jgi:hypothetical protein
MISGAHCEDNVVAFFKTNFDNPPPGLGILSVSIGFAKVFPNSV